MSERADPVAVSVYRIYSASSEREQFTTDSGSRIWLNPGGVVDVLSFQVNHSASFAELESSEKIRKIVSHTFLADQDFMDELAEEIRRSRPESNGPDDEAPAEPVTGADPVAEAEPAGRSAPRERPPKASASMTTKISDKPTKESSSKKKSS